MMENLALHGGAGGGGGGTRPTPFPLFTITYKVAVYAPAERADTFPYFISTLMFSVPAYNKGEYKYDLPSPPYASPILFANIYYTGGYF